MAILVQPKEQKRRAVFKTVSWRIIGSLDTMLISFLVMWLVNLDGTSGFFTKAGLIGLLEIPNKLLLFYFHERIWARIQFGMAPRDDYSI